MTMTALEGTPSARLSSHDRILDSAKQLFATRGYENTSTAAIARRAGTSESQLMKHFGSKEGLLEAIFDVAWKRINAAVVDARAGAQTPARKLETLVGLMLTAFERDPELKLLMLLEGRRIRKEGHLVMLTAGFQQFVGTVDSILREMRGAGQLRPDLPVEGVRSALMGVFEGLLRDQLLARRLGFPARYSGKDMRAIFAAVVAGLAPAGSRRRPRP